MEEKEIRRYAQLMKEMDLTGLEISKDGSVLRLERAPSTVSVTENTASRTAAQQAKQEKTQRTDLTEVCSPMVGVFYAAPSEQAAPYVKAGDKVKRGDILCIIEAMKLMNEILAEEDGTVVEVCAKNRQIVDFGHVLFRIQKEQETV